MGKSKEVFPIWPNPQENAKQIPSPKCFNLEENTLLISFFEGGARFKIPTEIFQFPPLHGNIQKETDRNR